MKTLTTALIALILAASASAADQPLPVITSVTKHPDGGCVIHYEDGSERHIATCPTGVVDK